MKAPIRILLPVTSLCLVSAVAMALGATSAGAAPTVPYTDPSAVGYVGLCNSSGQQITSGNINTTPFVSARRVQ